MQFITLLTDFGLRDGYAGVMKGVIYRIAPHAQITDITHTIQPQNIMEGSLTLNRAYRYFPPGTVHVAVVDPGVGTHRRPLAGQVGEHFFVCPDNGLLTPVLESAERAGQPFRLVHLDQPGFWLPQVSNVFHGRDIFAPVAAHLAVGIPLSDLGSTLSDPIRLELPRPQSIAGGWRGQVIAADHFGNLTTNLERTLLAADGPMQVLIAGRVIHGIARTFGDGQPGDLLAIIDSSDHLSICVVNGSAQNDLKTGPGEPVEVRRTG